RGALTGILHIHNDITARKLLEAELRASKENLEVAVRERTRELEAELERRLELEQQLRQSQKLEAIGHLTGGIAHDFNNLLTAVLGNIELVLLRPSEHDEMHLQEACAAALRGAELTRSLLAFSRQQSLHPVCVELGALVGALEKLLTLTLGERFELTTEVDA